VASRPLAEPAVEQAIAQTVAPESVNEPGASEAVAAVVVPEAVLLAQRREVERTLQDEQITPAEQPPKAEHELLTEDTVIPVRALPTERTVSPQPIVAETPPPEALPDESNAPPEAAHREEPATILPTPPEIAPPDTIAAELEPGEANEALPIIPLEQPPSFAPIVHEAQPMSPAEASEAFVEFLVEFLPPQQPAEAAPDTAAAVETTPEGAAEQPPIIQIIAEKVQQLPPETQAELAPVFNEIRGIVEYIHQLETALIVEPELAEQVQQRLETVCRTLFEALGIDDETSLQQFIDTLLTPPDIPQDQDDTITTQFKEGTGTHEVKRFRRLAPMWYANQLLGRVALTTLT